MHAAMFRMSQAGVKIAKTNMVIAELESYWGNESAAEIGELYAKRLPHFGYIYAHLQYIQSKK